MDHDSGAVDQRTDARRTQIAQRGSNRGHHRVKSWNGFLLAQRCEFATYHLDNHRARQSRIAKRLKNLFDSGNRAQLGPLHARIRMRGFVARTMLPISAAQSVFACSSSRITAVSFFGGAQSSSPPLV